MHEIWAAELDGIVKLGGCCIFTMHPQVIGRPHRLAFLDRFIGEVMARDDVWIASCGEIAAAAQL
ncbi:MAG: peptidoglycan-N-acetylglucosamine deacetylase [Gaiellales bacterium]|nr:peptidoglycan-N-acetylglucosamine deacetylase [Gaiellales bacterium]